MTLAAELSAVAPVLRATLDALLAPLAAGGFHWLRAQLPADGDAYTLPLIVVRFGQRGKLRPYVGGPASWEGEIIVRMLAETQDGAEQLARDVAGALPTSIEVLDSVTGNAWSVGFKPAAAPPQPPSGAAVAEMQSAYMASVTRSAT
jgi:hypothetical protein